MNSFPKVWSTILQQSSYSDSRTLIREITRLLYTGNIWPLGSNHCNFLLTCLTFVLNTPLQVLQEPWSLAPKWKVVLLLWSVKAASFPAHFFYYLKLSPWEYAQLFRSDPKESMTPGGKFFAGFKVHCDIIFNLFKRGNGFPLEFKVLMSVYKGHHKSDAIISFSSHSIFVNLSMAPSQWIPVQASLFALAALKIPNKGW